MLVDDVVRFRYSGGSTPGSMRVVRVTGHDSDTVHAFDLVHNAIRNFKTDRMSEIEVLVDNSEEIEDLQTELESANERIDELEQENCDLNDQIAELEYQIDDCPDEVGNLSLTVYKDNNVIFTASSADNNFDLNFNGMRFVFTNE